MSIYPSFLPKLRRVVQAALVFFGLGLTTSVALADGKYETIHRFHPAEGLQPGRGLVETGGGALMGVTIHGGMKRPYVGREGCGLVYALAAHRRYRTVHVFTGAHGDGCVPIGQLYVAGKSLIGATVFDGFTGGDGTIFEITEQGVHKTLHRFQGEDGSGPNGSLINGVDGFLWGTTSAGGAFGRGVIYKMDLLGNVQVVYSFNENDHIGFGPGSGLVLGPDGNLYGTASSNTAGGTVYKVTPQGAVLPVHEFTPSEGMFPGALKVASDGYLYGALAAGARGAGALYRMDLAGEFTSLHAFTNGDDGGSPVAPPTEVSPGVFLGSTYGGGPVLGTIFQYDTKVSEFTLLRQVGSDPAGCVWPDKMLKATDGRVYGTCAQGGKANAGMVFVLTQGNR